MSILLLRGYSQSGKDFIGKILCKQYGYQRFAFADSLKRLVSKKYDVPMEKLHSQSGKLEICNSDEKHRTFRQILIDEALLERSKNDACFAEDCCKEIEKMKATRIVITDWRYTKELELLKSNFPDYVITPIHVVCTLQQESPVCDISEYQLEDRQNDIKLLNHLDERIYHDIQEIMKQIISQ
jgi:hypothetical protein